VTKFDLLDACWNTDLPTTPRFVLLTLAKHADANGAAFPAVSRLCELTGLKERAVREALRLIEVSGHITRRHALGKPTNYVIHPCVKCTPAQDAPVHDVHPCIKDLSPLHLMPVTPAPSAYITDHITDQVIDHLSEHAPVAIAPPPASGEKRTERGTRLPDDWQPKRTPLTEYRDKAPSVNIATEVEKFCNYWHSKPGAGGRRIDWEKTFINWLLTAQERAPRNMSGAAPKQSLADQSLALGREWLDRLAAADAAESIGIEHSNIIEGEVYEISTD